MCIRDSTWTDSKEADTARKRELCDQLRTIQRYATDTARGPFPKLERECSLGYFREDASRRVTRAAARLPRPRVASRAASHAIHTVSRPRASSFTRATRD